MKRFIHIGIWSITVIAVLVLLGFANNQHKAVPVVELVVKLEAPAGMRFINDEDVKARITDLGSAVEGEPMSKADIRTMEQTVLKMPEVESAQVYRTMDGNIVVEATQRTPIVRIINADSTSFYLDKNGYPMPLSSRYSARVLVFTGAINEHPSGWSVSEILANDSLAEAHLLDDIYAMAMHVNGDKFWSSQIQHIYVNAAGELELLPRVGNHRILFGRAERMDEKLENLKLFYTHGLKNQNWNSFDTLNLKYKDQIVCTKK